MTLHPVIQTKGQQEIDHVIGNDRLPKLADRDALRYVEAIVKEVFRWNPVLPIGLSSFRSTCFTQWSDEPRRIPSQRHRG